MNLVMRGIRPGNIDTRCADSLGEDWPIEKTGPNAGRPLYVDAVVSNPPYSQHWDPSDAEMDARFKDYGVAPKSKADYAFLLHELHHLKPDGILTIVLPHGVLFRGDPEDDGEGKIRKKLIEKNQIDCIIGLPANIFFGTGIPTLIMVLKQHRQNDDVLIIDASKGFVKDGKNNKLRDCDIKRIADTVRLRSDEPGYSRKVSREIIRENNYNLNIPRYVDSSEAPEQYDIYATMFGGIPNSEIELMKKYWDALPSLRRDLFQPASDKPYSAITTDDVATAIEHDSDTAKLRERFAKAFDGFAEELHERLITNVSTVRELKERYEIADDIFQRLADIPLIDRYAAYQAMSNGWQTIANDIETIQTDGIDAARVVETAYKLVKKGDEDIEVPDGLKGRIIPFSLVQQTKFQAELQAISDKESRSEEIDSEVDELRDGFTDEETQEYMEGDDNPKLDKAKIKKDAKAKGDDIEPETKAKLKLFVKLWDEQSKLNKAIKEEKLALIDKTKEAIENLTDEEVEQFLHMKWIDPVLEGINGTLTSVLNEMEKSITTLARKYAVSYNDLGVQLDEAQQEISKLVADLTGDEFALQGLHQLNK